MRNWEVDRLQMNYDDVIRDEFVGYGFGRVNSLGRFKTAIVADEVNAYVTVNIVPDDIRGIPFLVEHPFTERLHVMIMSAPNGLRVEEIVPVANRTDKTAT